MREWIDLAESLGTEDVEVVRHEDAETHSTYFEVRLHGEKIGFATYQRFEEDGVKKAMAHGFIKPEYRRLGLMKRFWPMVQDLARAEGREIVEPPLSPDGQKAWRGRNFFRGKVEERYMKWPDQSHGPDIGPHQRHELELMLQGKKPVAIIDAITPAWEKAIREHGWIAKRIPSFVPSYDQYAVALPGQEFRIAMLERIYRENQEVGVPLPDAIHVRLGRILGYSKDQIRAFLRKIQAKR